MLREIHLGGVYFAPFALDLVLALLVFFPTRWLLDRCAIDRWVWHRPFVDVCVFVVIVSLIGLFG